MSSSWRAEIAAVLVKELRSESRSRSALMTVGLFGVVSVVALALATFGRTITPGVAAGLLWVALLFSAIIALPRAFVAEEEQGTGDLLRLVARPHAIFWGKALYNLLQMLLAALLLSVLFFTLTGVEVSAAGLYAVCLLSGSAALAGAVTLSGALVAQAANRSALVGAIALPLLLPLMFLAVQGLSAAIEGPGPMYGAGVQAAVGLAGYAVVAFAVSPYLFAAVWKP
jgi:heme exporter protein B